MVPDVVWLVVVILAISMLPAAMLAGMFAIIDYFADDEKLEEIKRVQREGRAIDFSGDGGSSAESTDKLQPVRPPGEQTDGGPPVESDSVELREHADLETEQSTDCSNCGRPNELGFDRCWNCQAKL